MITSAFLALSGLERFLVEFIRINPRVILGMNNAQFAAALTAVAGIALLIFLRTRVSRRGNRSPYASSRPPTKKEDTRRCLSQMSRLGIG